MRGRRGARLYYIEIGGMDYCVERRYSAECAARKRSVPVCAKQGRVEEGAGVVVCRVCSVVESVQVWDRKWNRRGRVRGWGG